MNCDRVTALVAAMLVSVSLYAQPLATLRVHGTPGSAIGARDYLFTSDDKPLQIFVIAAAHRLALPGLVDAIEFQFGDDPISQVRLRFESGRGPLAGLPESWNHPLTLGFYDRAMRAQAQDSPHPGVSLRLNGWAANQHSGRFVILAADYKYENEAPILLRFAAIFEITSVTEPLSPVTGEFFYNFEPNHALSLSQQRVTGPAHLMSQVRLVTPAPAGGATIELSTNEPDILSLPSELLIPEGQQDASFPVEVSETDADYDVDILSVYNRTGSVTTLHAVPKRTPISVVDVQGDPRAWIYPGHFHSKTDTSWIFNVDYLPRLIEIRSFDDVNFWSFYFLRNTAQPLTPGFYVAPPWGDPPSAPQLRIGAGDSSGAGRGCSLNSGWFEIHDMNIDYSFDPPKLTRFWATFQHTCEGNPPTTVRGTVMYNEPPSARGRAVH